MKGKIPVDFVVGFCFATTVLIIGYVMGYHSGVNYNDDDWQSGYSFGWLDGCSHYYNIHGWSTGEGCGYGTEEERLNATRNKEQP